MNHDRLLDPQRPIEACPDCLEMFPDDSHACTEPDKESLLVPGLLLAIMWGLIVVLGWAIWTALKYHGLIK